MNERLKLSQPTQDYLFAILAFIHQSYATSEEGNIAQRRIEAQLVHQDIVIDNSDSLAETAVRREVAHTMILDILTTRKQLHLEEPELGELVDRMLHHAIYLTEHVMGMGGSLADVLQKSLKADHLKERHSVGGKKGSLTRIEWQVEARARYDRFIFDHPRITTAPRIVKGILKEGPILGAPSEGRIVEVVREWRR